MGYLLYAHSKYLFYFVFIHVCVSQWKNILLLQTSRPDIYIKTHFNTVMEHFFAF